MVSAPKISWLPLGGTITLLLLAFVTVKIAGDQRDIDAAATDLA